MTGITGGSVSASYAYDYQGERIKKTVGGVETGYLYQAEDIIKETSGGIVTDYLHGIGIDDPVYLDRSGAKSYYFGDGLGSIREMTDATGTVQNSYGYGAWGELRTQNTTVANNYGHTGREFAEEGNNFHRARYYNPMLGKFISRDPIMIKTKMYFYSYTQNDPINWVDPDGFVRRPVPGGIRVDSEGDGNWCTDRSGRTRLHHGIDFLGNAGDLVEAPDSGTVYIQGKHSVEICNIIREMCCNGQRRNQKACWFLTHIVVDITDDTSRVQEGSRIGTIQDLGNPNMYNHVHVELRYYIYCDPNRYLFIDPGPDL